MARIQALPGGRDSKFQYGTQARFTFSIRFPTEVMNAPGAANSAKPTAGTLTIAGATVTLVAADLLNPSGVAAKIKAATIAGYTVEYFPSIAPFTVTLINNSIGVTAAPTAVLGTATNILFYDQTFRQGTAIVIGAQDDIEIEGRVPVNFTITFTGGTVPDLQFSNGTDQEQAAGSLVYGTAVTLATVNGLTQSYTLTTPAHYARLTTKASNTTAALYISR